MCCCRTCRDKPVKIVADKDQLIHLERLKPVVERFPVSMTINGKEFWFTSVEEIEEKQEEILQRITIQ